MVPNSGKRRNPRIPRLILGIAKEVYELFLDGHVPESRKVRRRLISLIKNELDKDPKNTRLWCMLGDLYTHKAKRMDCFCAALRVDPSDAEANAEIARLYAESHNCRYAKCIDRALEHCRSADIEESVIWAALEAARIARDHARIQTAINIGRTRFPESSLFETR